MNVRSQRSVYKRREEAGRPVTPRRVYPPGHKRCPDCELVLPFDCFGRNQGAADGLTAYCKPCHNQRGKASLERRGGSRRYHLKRRYGISVEDDDRMLEEQGGLCAICEEAPAAHVDHCHSTGNVRGLTCFNCNGGLGQFKDRVDILRNAIDYLERNTPGPWQTTPTSADGYPASTPTQVTAASRLSSLGLPLSSSRPA